MSEFETMTELCQRRIAELEVNGHRRLQNGDSTLASVDFAMAREWAQWLRWAEQKPPKLEDL